MFRCPRGGLGAEGGSGYEHEMLTFWHFLQVGLVSSHLTRRDLCVISFELVGNRMG
jgi:hypothetical protein